MSRIVSYSFFRRAGSQYEDPKVCGADAGQVFVRFLPAMIRAHYAIWTGWDLVIQHDDRVKDYPYFKTLKALHQAGLLTLVDMGEAKQLCRAMLWRMRPIWSPEAEYVVCRDIDSIPTPRDRRCVEEFINSGKMIHTIHDASAHSGIMGGTVGVYAPKMKQVFKSWEQFEDQQSMFMTGDQWDRQGADQNFLNGYFWPNPNHRKEIFLHELHHPTDMADHCETHMTIGEEPPADMRRDVAQAGDLFSKGIGFMPVISTAMEFYNSLAIPEIQMIQQIEESTCPPPTVTKGWPPGAERTSK